MKILNIGKQSLKEQIEHILKKYNHNFDIINTFGLQTSVSVIFFYRFIDYIFMIVERGDYISFYLDEHSPMKRTIVNYDAYKPNLKNEVISILDRIFI